MLQEFLTALNGITGDIFVEDDNGIIKIIDELPFIVPSEQSLMNEVCILGTYYKRMQRFINTFSSPLINKDTSGLYKVSLSHGVAVAIEEYRNDLLLIQKELLIDQFLLVSYIKAKLNDYFILFPTLWKILDCVNKKNLNGCQLLDAIFKNIPVGNPKIKSILNKILNRCNHVFFRQLSAWILRGALLDPYHEFFIEAVLEATEKKSSIATNKAEPILIDNMAKSELTALVYESTERQRAKSFKINEKNIPCYIPFSLVNKILFIGESVHFFDKNRESILINDWTDSSECGNKLENELSEKFSQQLNDLQLLEGFNLLKVQEVIENVEKYMMKRMWSLLVEENRFLEEYHSEVKDFLLLGRGELFMVFITNMEKNMINCSISSSTESSINIEFLKAARAVLLDKESTITKFRFVLNRNSGAGGLKWEDIDVTYKVRWPFHIVFTGELLKSYNDLFRFLIMLKRTQMRLNALFSIKRLRGLAHVGQWQLRNHMSFFMNNLQYYIQVDVIESQMSIFGRKVADHEDIEVLKASHEALVNTLKAHSFLFNGTIHAGIVNICDVCGQFASLIELMHASVDGDHRHEADGVNARLQGLQQRFQSLSTTLYNILSNVEGHSAANPHLRQLLVILDFNSFFSVLGAQIGSLKKSSAANVKKFTV